MGLIISAHYNYISHDVVFTLDLNIIMIMPGWRHSYFHIRIDGKNLSMKFQEISDWRNGTGLYRPSKNGLMGYYSAPGERISVKIVSLAAQLSYLLYFLASWTMATPILEQNSHSSAKPAHRQSPPQTFGKKTQEIDQIFQKVCITDYILYSSKGTVFKRNLIYSFSE